MGQHKRSGAASTSHSDAYSDAPASRLRDARLSLSLADYPQDIFNTRKGVTEFSQQGSALGEDSEVPDDAEHAQQDGHGHDAMNWLYSNDNDQTPRAGDGQQYAMNMTEDFMQFGRGSEAIDYQNFTGLLSPQVSRQNSNTDPAAEDLSASNAVPGRYTTDHRQYMNVQGDFRALGQTQASITPGLLMGAHMQSAEMQAAASSGSPMRIMTRLLAPTSMRRSSDEDSQTYLNKSQVYGLSLADPEFQPQSRPTKYRTTVKALFHDEDQKQRAAAFWSIWRDGRGTSEAIERKASSVRALEFDEAGSLRMTEKHKAEMVSRPILVAEAFDGFTVDWSPARQAPYAQTMLALRCHFLSTDFSHSKGVRGVSLKLAVQTQLLSSQGNPILSRSACLIKLFRDKGAERKAANDLSHIRKALQRLEDPACKSQGGTANSAVIQKAHARRESDFQARVQHRRKRSNSVSSQSSAGASLSDGFSRQDEIAMYRDMLASIVPVTELRLALEADDNMTLSFDDEVALLNDHQAELLPQPQDVPFKPETLSPQILYRPSILPTAQPVRAHDQRTILVADIDQNYVSPKPQKKPIRCIYFIQHADATRNPQETLSPVSQGSPDPGGLLGRSLSTSDSSATAGCADDKTALPPLYRAIYLFEISVNAFVSAIATKLRIDSDKHKIVRCVRENSRGIRILLEDEMLERMPDGQDITIRLHEVGSGQFEIVLFYTLG